MPGRSPIIAPMPESDPLHLPIRPRRLRVPALRRLLRTVALRRSDVIVPVFIVTRGLTILMPDQT